MSKTTTRPTSSSLIEGPVWKSLEQFCRGDEAALNNIPDHGVGVIVHEITHFRIMREDDFQRLIGLATEVQRIQQAFNIALQNAKAAAQHPDNDHMERFIKSATSLGDNLVFSTRDGLGQFQLTQDEISAQDVEDLDFEEISQPRL